MKLFHSFLFSVLILFGFSSHAQRKIDVLHYTYNIEISDKTNEITGEASIEFVTLEKTNTVSFDLQNVNALGKGMKILHVMAGSATYEHRENKITLHGNYFKNDTAIVTIEYKGIPDDGLIISKNKYGDRTFFADNWPDRAHHWIPCVDDPDDKATCEFIVTAHTKYRVISNGKKIEEKNLENNLKLTHWKEDVPLPTKVMVIGVAKFAVKNYADSPKGTPVSAWVFPQDSARGFRNYSVATDIVKFYSNYIAPFPYNKLANIQSLTIFGGMENASAIFYHERTASALYSQESLMAHEIAHQWFGDMATEKSFPHLWLSEGFATYMTHIYMESKYGTDSMNKQMIEDRDQVIVFSKQNHHAVVDSVSPFRDLLNPNSYQKGSWVLHMLRRELGDPVFHKIIRSYYEKYKGKNADTKDFENVAEEVSGKKLDTFFYQWLYLPDIPQLKMSWQYIEKEKKISLKVEQVQKGFVFSIPLEIRLNSGRKSQIKKIYVTQSMETFTIALEESPLQIELDPNTSLLFTEIKNN